MSPSPQVNDVRQATVLHYRAFSKNNVGGNEAGVVLDASVLSADSTAMKSIAAEVGYSETVFVTDGPPVHGRHDYSLRYFSPSGEVPFCGHATIAGSVAITEALGDKNNAYRFHTAAGTINVETGSDLDGLSWSSITTVAPQHRAVDETALKNVLKLLNWTEGDLDPVVPPAEIYAGSWHLCLAVNSREVLAGMRFDLASLSDLAAAHGWITLHLVFRSGTDIHHVRAPFPAGGIEEDPATGAAAAAYGAYLRTLGLIHPPSHFTIVQGEDMGKPCHIHVTVPPQGPVTISGEAVRFQAVEPAGGTPASLAPRSSPARGNTSST
jgi:PhzF family phenazine biosynthesis protein